MPVLHLAGGSVNDMQQRNIAVALNDIGAFMHKIGTYYDGFRAGGSQPAGGTGKHIAQLVPLVFMLQSGDFGKIEGM
jgi:hypothetical protein